ncbi:MAG: Gldg family protein [Verrucomicrobiota bacterium]
MPDVKEQKKGEGDAETPEKKEQKAVPRGLSRLPIAGHVVTQIILAIILFGTVNYLSFRHFNRGDLSANKKYTISVETESFLASVDRPVTVTMSFLNNSVIRDNLKALLDRYREMSKGMITVDDVDPSRDRNRANEIEDKYKLRLNENALIVEVDGRIKTILESEMMDKEGRFFRGEDAVTSTLIAALEGEPKKVYVVAGKGTLLQFENRTALDLIGEISASQFFNIEFLTLSEVRAVPQDAAALVLLGLEVDLTSPELEMIREYWASNRGSMIVLLDPAADTPVLDGFLTEHGLTPRNDRVLEATGLGTKNFEVEGAFLPGSIINRNLANLTTILPGITCSLEVADDEELTKRGIGIIALLQAGSRFWGEANYGDPQPMLDDEDTAPPVYVAAAIEIGATEDLRLRLETSRMAVIGNSRLLDPDVATATNASFITSTINWALDREELIGIPPKTATRWQIALTPVQHQNMFNLVVFILPAIVFSIALVMWSARRT